MGIRVVYRGVFDGFALKAATFCVWLCGHVMERVPDRP